MTPSEMTFRDELAGKRMEVDKFNSDTQLEV